MKAALSPMFSQCTNDFGVLTTSIANKEVTKFMMAGESAEDIDIVIRECLYEIGFARKGKLSGELTPDGSIKYTQPFQTEPVDFDKLFDYVAESFEIRTELGLAALKQAIGNVAVLDSKHRDYGKTNLSEFGELGLLVRLNDKIGRLKNLIAKTDEPKNESLADTWLDSANYSLLGQLMNAGILK